MQLVLLHGKLAEIQDRTQMTLDQSESPLNSVLTPILACGEAYIYAQMNYRLTPFCFSLVMDIAASLTVLIHAHN